MATIYAVVSPHSKIQIKTELLSPHSTTRTPTPQRPLRPVNKAGEPGKARRQLAMNLNKGGPVINNRRNARERNRVKQVNQGFAVLRAHLPAAQEKSKKVSKVDTLRGAIDYIQSLSELLASTPEPPPPPPYGYRPDGGLLSAPLQPYPGAVTPLSEHGTYLPEPPPYRHTVRELRHHQHQHQHHQHQHHHQQLAQLSGLRPEEAELLGALRWWPPASPPPPPSSQPPLS